MKMADSRGYRVDVAGVRFKKKGREPVYKSSIRTVLTVVIDIDLPLTAARDLVCSLGRRQRR